MPQRLINHVFHNNCWWSFCTFSSLPYWHNCSTSSFLIAATKVGMHCQDYHAAMSDQPCLSQQLSVRFIRLLIIIPLDWIRQSDKSDNQTISNSVNQANQTFRHSDNQTNQTFRHSDIQTNQTTCKSAIQRFGQFWQPASQTIRQTRQSEQSVHSELGYSFVSSTSYQLVRITIFW